MSQPIVKTDGRHQRARRNKRAVVEAMIALVRETETVPSAEDVARRAGVSRRTVFRLFDDLESLHRAAHEHQQTEVVRRFPPPVPKQGDSLEDHIRELVEHRAAVYEYVAPQRRLAERLRAEQSYVDQTLRSSRQSLRLHLELLLAEALEKTPNAELVVESAEQITSWTAWETLRNDQGCSVEDARRVVELTLQSLLRL